MERINQARLRTEWVWLFVCGAAYLAALLLTGCSAADVEGGGRDGLTAGTGAGTNAAGTSGGGSGGAAGGIAGVGNPEGPPAQFDASVVDARTSDPDMEDCGGTAVEPTIKRTVIPGNILFVYDMSGSMRDVFPTTGRTKWEEARDAVTNAITPLADSVNVGVVFFPLTNGCGSDDDRGDSCCVPAFGTDAQINFLPGAEFLTAWSTFWGPDRQVDGNTPTMEALQAAGAALSSVAGTLTGKTAVVLITDGDPNCGVAFPDLGFFPTQEQIDMAIAGQVAQLVPLPTDWLATLGIATHVFGLPGPTPNALPVLNGIAMSGGTTQHISADNPMTLQTEIAKIIGESVSTSFDTCSIGLPKEPPDPNDVQLVVVESGLEQSVARDLGTGGGWTLSGSGASMEIILQGELCNNARAGTYDKISVVFGCVDLPPLEPPDPPE